jgi:hypothetical protein
MMKLKSPRDDIIRGIEQCYEPVCAKDTIAVLFTTMRVARRPRVAMLLLLHFHKVLPEFVEIAIGKTRNSCTQHGFLSES